MSNNGVNWNDGWDDKPVEVKPPVQVKQPEQPISQPKEPSKPKTEKPKVEKTEKPKVEKPSQNLITELNKQKKEMGLLLLSNIKRHFRAGSRPTQADDFNKFEQFFLSLFN